MAYRIINAAKRHIPQLEDIERQCFSMPWSAQQLETQLPDDRHIFIVAEDEGHVLGYVGTYNAVALLLAFCQYLPAGVCLALSYRMSGTFLCPVLIHSIINLIGVFTVC